MEKEIVLKKGTVFVLTNGEYSDYSLMTVCKAIVDIDIIELRKEYLAIHPEQSKDYRFEHSAYLKWLIVDKKVAKEFDFYEWHIDNYGKCSEDDDYYLYHE